MNIDQQLLNHGITQDMIASVFDEPAPAAPTGPDLAGELMTLMHMYRAVSIFKLGDLHFELTGRRHHQCQLWETMNELERAGKVRCDFSTGQRVWHLVYGQ